jgi:predicted nucleic acid-binding Zn ribbon protein
MKAKRQAMILFEFSWECGNKFEALVLRDVKETDCPQCDLTAKRVISAVRCSLDPTSGHFPGATEKWIKAREQKMALESKAAEQ